VRERDGVLNLVDVQNRTSARPREAAIADSASPLGGGSFELTLDTTTWRTTPYSKTIPDPAGTSFLAMTITSLVPDNPPSSKDHS
jgi:hypothetical protein